MTDTPAARFAHHPRPPVKARAPYEAQLYFGVATPGDDVVRQLHASVVNRVSVRKIEGDEKVRLNISTRALNRAAIDLSIYLSAEDLQRLACALLDAAAHMLARDVTPPSLPGDVL